MRLYEGYSETMFNQHRLKQVSRNLATTLPGLMKQTGATAIAVRGKSGIALAFAMSAVSNTNIPIVVCRKPAERSHGSNFEGPDLDSDGLKYLILDDFVSSGKTVKAVERAMRNIGAECVGIAVYVSDRGSDGPITLNRKDVPIFVVRTRRS